MKIPFNDAFLLLLYLLPGFLAMQLYRSRYPAKRVTQFETIVWSVLHSFIVHLILTGLALVTQFEAFNLLSGTGDPKIEASTISVLLAGGSIWGLALILFHWLRIRIPFIQSPDPQAIWPLAAAGVASGQLWAIVRTKEGGLYLGWIEKYSFDPSAEDHDFLLRPAYLVDDELKVQRDLSGGAVYLNTRDIDALEMIPGRE